MRSLTEGIEVLAEDEGDEVIKAADRAEQRVIKIANKDTGDTIRLRVV